MDDHFPSGRPPIEPLRESGMVVPPHPHDGIRRALRNSFASPQRLPEDWARLLGRLP